MERLAETEDPDESRDHRLLARWIKHFLEDVPEEIASRIASLSTEGPEGLQDPSHEEGGTPYMESDEPYPIKGTQKVEPQE